VTDFPGNPTGTIQQLQEYVTAIEQNAGFPESALLGNLQQLAAAVGDQPAPARTNLGLLGGTLADGALNGTEVATVVAVPVKPGDIITKVKLLIGKTKGKKVENAFAAVYPGTKEGVLLGQSKSVALGETVLAEKPLEFTLEKPVTVTAAMAPGGFLYVAVAMEAETMPTCISVSASSEAQKAISKLGPLSPEFMSAKAGAALKAAAKEKIEGPAIVAVIPVVVLH
jgi:hypothetical protein